MKAEETRTCLVCGTRFPTTKEFCPVCMLREALDEEIKPAKTSLKGVGLSRRGRRPPYRFEHYDLVIGKDGKPVELGRGAMGVTYKAFDINLRCPVTLKVISERYVGDQSAQLRFLREARAAASVRHPNVAAVKGDKVRSGSHAEGPQCRSIAGPQLGDAVDAVIRHPHIGSVPGHA